MAASTNDHALVDYARQLREQLRVDADAEGGELTLSEAFTHRVIETLVEVGVAEEVVASHHENLRRGIAVSAYGIEDDHRLNLFGTVYLNEDPPPSLPPRAVEQHIERVLRFWAACRDGA